MYFDWIKIMDTVSEHMRKCEWHLSSIWCHVIMLTRIIIDSSASGRLLEICPRDNNNLAIIYLQVYY